MLIKAERDHITSDNYEAWFYDISEMTSDFSISGILLNGRYPAEKYAKNTVCSFYFQVLQGKGKFIVGSSILQAIPGDIILVPANTAYSIIPAKNNSLKLWLISTPTWSMENHSVDVEEI